MNTTQILKNLEKTLDDLSTIYYNSVGKLDTVIMTKLYRSTKQLESIYNDIKEYELSK